MTTLELLTKAQNLIRPPQRWTQDCFARDEHGQDVYEPTNEEATCWCSLGAVMKVAGLPSRTNEHEAFIVLELALPMIGSDRTNIPDFNDAAEHDEVMRLFDKARDVASAIGV